MLTRDDLRFAYVASAVVSIVMTAVSLLGVFAWPVVYPGVEPKMIPLWVGQDALNLVVGLPLLAGSMWLARRGALIGLLLWPGALFYVIYDYGFYALGAPFTSVFLAYLGVIALGAYAMASVVFAIDRAAVAQRVAHVVPRRLTAGSLIAIAALFTVLWTGLSMSAAASGAPVDPVVRAVVTLDLTVQLPALFVGGLLLWGRRPLGYVLAPMLLIQAAAYLIGLAAITVLTEVVMATPFDPFAVIPWVVVGALCLCLIAPFVRASGARSAAPAVAKAVPRRPSGATA